MQHSVQYALKFTVKNNALFSVPYQVILNLLVFFLCLGIPLLLNLMVDRFS